MTTEAVSTLMTYRGLTTHQDFEIENLTVVLAAPCQPEELRALADLKQSGLLAMTVLLERGGPGRWGGVFGKKPDSPTANYLMELNYDEGGWLEWEPGEKSLNKLLSVIEDTRTEPNGFFVVYCGEEGEPSFEGESPLNVSQRASKYVSRIFAEARDQNTVFARFAEYLKTEVHRRDMFAVGPGDLEDLGGLRRRLAMFREMAEASESRPILLLHSVALAALYGELRQWCDAPSGVRVTMVVHGSGLPPKGQDCVGGLTDASLLLSIPHLRVAVPADESQAEGLFQEMRESRACSAIVFSSAPAVGFPSHSASASGSVRMLRSGKDASILAIGSTVYPALLAAESLQTMGLDVGVYDMRYRRPIDRKSLQAAIKDVRLVVSVDEHPDAGSFAGHLWSSKENGPRLLRLGIEVEDAENVLAAAPGEMLTLEHFGLHAEGIAKSIKSSMRLAPPTAFG